MQACCRMLFSVGCLTSQQHACLPQGRICSDNWTCCYAETEVVAQTFYPTQSHYTDTGPTSPSADPITPSARQGSHGRASFQVTGVTRPRKNAHGASGNRTPRICHSRKGHHTHIANKAVWGRYHGSRRPSSDDSLRSPTVILPSALDQPSIMKRYHRRRPCSHTSPRRSTTMVTLHDTGFVECRWWNDGWTVKTVVT